MGNEEEKTKTTFLKEQTTRPDERGGEKRVSATDISTAARARSKEQSERRKGKGKKSYLLAKGGQGPGSHRGGQEEDKVEQAHPVVQGGGAPAARHETGGPRAQTLAGQTGQTRHAARRDPWPKMDNV